MIVSLTTNVIQTQKNYFKNQLNNKSILERNEFNKIINIIQETDLLKKNKDLSLLTFDNKFLIWFILNNVKFLKIANGVMVPRKNEMIENDLINTFKFLNLSIKDFELFLENKKLSYWRYRNENVTNLFAKTGQKGSIVPLLGGNLLPIIKSALFRTATSINSIISVGSYSRSAS